MAGTPRHILLTTDPTRGRVLSALQMAAVSLRDAESQLAAAKARGASPAELANLGSVVEVHRETYLEYKNDPTCH